MWLLFWLACQPDPVVSLDGDGPVVLCFHGAGGSSQGWTKGDKGSMVEALEAADFAVVCPSSDDRITGQWSATNDASNVDVVAVDELLDELDVAAGRPLVLLGHSNGGGFTGRYIGFGARAADVAAVQLSNAAGLSPVLSDDAYQPATRFAFADCDQKVDSGDVRANVAVLEARGVVAETERLDARYAALGDEDCHSFLDTSEEAIPFFDEAAAYGAGR